jgi:hypothetical protein
LRDDTALGDTDGDPNQPAAGDWMGISFESGSTGNLNGVEVRYAGGYGWSFYEGPSSLHSNTSSLTINDTEVRNGSGPGIYLNDAATITNSHVLNGSGPAIVLVGAASMGASVRATTATGNSINGMVVPGSLPSTPTTGTWSSDLLPYVLQGVVSVPGGVTLTIQPGTVVKTGTYYYGLQVYGTLQADRSGGNPITFTSLRDDTLLGDTDGDPNQPAARAGDWRGIGFESGSTGNLNGVEVRYAGGATWAASEDNSGIRSDTSSLTVTNSKLLNGSGAAIFLTDAASMGASVRTTTASGNGINGMVVPNGSLPTTPTTGTWSSDLLPYVLRGMVTVPGGVTLTIKPGTVVKAGRYFEALQVFGALRADETGNRTYFTSLQDDTLLPGTDGDPNHPAPLPGNWKGIGFESGSTGSLSNVEVRYAGGSPWAAFEDNSGIHSDSASLTITNSRLLNGSGAAIFLTDAASMGASVRTTTASGNGINGMVVPNGSLPTTPTTGTWSSDLLPYVLRGMVTVPGGVTLTIKPGTVVKAGRYFDALQVFGTLRADEMGNRTYFTSLQDDTLLPGTDGDPNHPVPTAGNWKGIGFESGSTGSLSNVEVRYAGGATWAAFEDNSGIHSDTSSLTITNSKLLNGSGAAIFLTGAASMGASVRTTTASGNGINGMVVPNGSLPTTPTTGTWSSDLLPYVLRGLVTVPSGVTLTIKPGTVVKSGRYFDALQVFGTLKAEGLGLRSYFTSLRDDTLLSGTDGDPNHPAPVAGDWKGIEFDATSTANILSNVEVRYAGGYDWLAFGDHSSVHVNAASLTLSRSTVSDGRGSGLYVSGQGTSPGIFATRFVKTEIGISFVGGSAGVVSESAFVSENLGVSIDSTSHPDLGLLTDQNPANDGFNSFVCDQQNVCSQNTTIVVPAENNWWGMAPYDPGLFCRTDNLDLDPFLPGEAEPPGGSSAPALAGLKVDRPPQTANVRLTWDDIASACGYDVYRATTLRPVPDFVNISGSTPLHEPTFTDASAAGPLEPNYFYTVRVH